jgi:hypothetical protein
MEEMPISKAVSANLGPCDPRRLPGALPEFRESYLSPVMGSGNDPLNGSVLRIENFMRSAFSFSSSQFRPA